MPGKQSIDGKKKKISLILLFVIIVIISLWFIKSPYSELLYNLDKLNIFIKEFGFLAPIIFIGLMILQIIFAPIPGHVVYLAGGYVFGVIGGILYGIIGLIIGTFIAISLGRLLGRPFVESVVKQEYINKFDKLTYDYGLIAIFILFLLPGPPDDALCFLAGLTDLDIKKLMISVVAGRVPGLVAMVLAGESLANSQWIYFILIIAIVAILSILALRYREKIMKVRKKF